MVAESILKLPENSEISRNFREGKIKINQIYMKFSISNLLFWFLMFFLSNSGTIFRNLNSNEH